MTILIGREPLTLPQLRGIARDATKLALAPESAARIDAAAQSVARILARGQPAYGINTGSGRLAQTRIEHEALGQLQTNIVLSHAAGTGPLLDAATVRLILALKIAALAQGHSGVRPDVIALLLELYAHGIHPCIPSKGTASASSHLAPPAHQARPFQGPSESHI